MPDLAPIQSWLDIQESAASQQWFVLADAALDSGLVASLKQSSSDWRALLEPQGDIIAAQGPHLFHIPPAAEMRALRYANPAAFTILCTEVNRVVLHRHLQAFTTAQLEGGLKMGFAFWDPAILGCVVGQSDDATLHVPGPVFDTVQLQAFLHPISAWWYWDRESRIHRIVPPPSPATTLASIGPPIEPLRLNQAQEDLLVEASVPDQILYHLELNQPYLFDQQLSPARRYRFVRAVLGPARDLGLRGMRDLVNFTAMCVIYRQRMQTDQAIVTLLDQVRLGQLSLDQAMERMPN